MYGSYGVWVDDEKICCHSLGISCICRRKKSLDLQNSCGFLYSLDSHGRHIAGSCDEWCCIKAAIHCYTVEWISTFAWQLKTWWWQGVPLLQQLQVTRNMSLIVLLYQFRKFCILAPILSSQLLPFARFCSITPTYLFDIYQVLWVSHIPGTRW